MGRSRELEAFDRLRHVDIGKPLCYVGDTKIYEDIACVRKALESIEIMKKNVYFEFGKNYVQLKDDKDLDWDYTIIYPISTEEIEILKEVFDDGKQHRLC